ncbi:hypothetical protein BG011_007045 [Mortierella polycephala]|uniref:HMG box domain-containing protein n=1 Tax=Mortierella polycephala TaxID=41804 RepID=A0A9P6PT53_9FUNG|nr:hypothetical protein BG011_007045 [Mortierella polycephala]
MQTSYPSLSTSYLAQEIQQNNCTCVSGNVAMEDTEMEDVSCSESEEGYPVSTPLAHPQDLANSEENQSSSATDFVFDAAAFTRILSQSTSDGDTGLYLQNYQQQGQSFESFAERKLGVNGTNTAEKALAILSSTSHPTCPSTTQQTQWQPLTHSMIVVDPFSCNQVALKAVSSNGTRSSLRLRQSIQSRLPQSASLRNQDDFILDQEQSWCETNVASSVVQHFSDMAIASSTPLSSCASLMNSTQAASLSTPHTSALPFQMAEAASTLNASAVNPIPESSTSVYFPPSASALHQKRRKAKKHALRVPRPKNCFMLYRSKAQPMIMVEFGAINNKIISKIAAERWRAESESVKTWYRQMAKQGKEEHARNNPGYKYAPHKKLLIMENAATRGRGLDGDVEDDEYDEDADGGYVDDDDGQEDDDNFHDGYDHDEEQYNSRRHYSKHRGALSIGVIRSNKRTKAAKMWGNDDKPYYGPRGSGASGGGSQRRRDNGFYVNKRPKPCKDQLLTKSLHSSPGMVSSTDATMGVSPALTPFPLNFPAYGSRVSSLSLMGHGLIEQQLYLNMQQQQQQQQIQVQLQTHQQPAVYQAHPPSTLFSAAYGQQPSLATPAAHAPSTPSIYNLSADQNASSVTLVDPVNNWMTHRYQDTAALFGHPEFAAANVLIRNHHSDDKGEKLSMLHYPLKYLMEKELPPLPDEAAAATTISTTNDHAVPHDDPHAVLSQLYLAYNPGANTAMSPSVQGFPMQFYQTKEPEPMAMSVNGGEPSSGLQQQQYMQQPQYLIKPTSPAGFMSFSDMFTWPDHTQNSNQ